MTAGRPGSLRSVLTGSHERNAWLAARLADATGLQPIRRPRVYVLVDGEPLKAQCLQRVGLELWNEDADLVLAAWPGELKSQAQALYGTHRARRVQELIERREGWRVEARPHLAYRLSDRHHRLYATPTIDATTYIDRWRAESLDRIGWPPERIRPELWPWMLERGYASPEDEAELEAFLARLGNRQAHLRPGLRISRAWPLDEVAELDETDGELVARLRRAFRELLAVLDEPATR